MKVGVIGGTGGQGLGIALRFTQVGEEVIIGSRTAEKAENAAKEIKELLGQPDANVRGDENPKVAEEADILILTVPLAAQKATCLSIKDQAAGKVMIDATGVLETAIGGNLTRCLYLPEGSAAQRSQGILPDTKVVCGLNNVSNAALKNYKEPIDCDILMAGDDAEAKATAGRLIDKMEGARSIDCGPLERAQIIEKITPLLIGLNLKKTCRDAGIRITGVDPECKLY